MCNLFRKKLGENIRNIRKKYNITQEQLALESLISRSHIAMIETGKRDVSMSTLFKLSRAMKVNLKEIFEFDDIKKYPFDVEEFYK